MKKLMNDYWKPTPKKWRKIGDSILAVATFVTAGTLIEFDILEKLYSPKELKIIIGVFFTLGVCGKFLTNFFTNEDEQTR
jgi:hypothetical protein